MLEKARGYCANSFNTSGLTALRHLQETHRKQNPVLPVRPRAPNLRRQMDVLLFIEKQEREMPTDNQLEQSQPPTPPTNPQPQPQPIGGETKPGGKPKDTNKPIIDGGTN